tara:strand:- start:1356 stop:1970 length:615 start_codon:yes stop_codon:yes gene_type:complete
MSENDDLPDDIGSDIENVLGSDTDDINENDNDDDNDIGNDEDEYDEDDVNGDGNTPDVPMHYDVAEDEGQMDNEEGDMFINSSNIHSLENNMFENVYDIDDDTTEVRFNPHDAIKLPVSEIEFSKPIKRFKYISKYEYTKIRGLRLHQLSNGYLPHLSENTVNMTFEQIFIKEFNSKKLPFIIVRYIGNNYAEYYKLSDLTYLG